MFNTWITEAEIRMKEEFLETTEEFEVNFI